MTSSPPRSRKPSKRRTTIEVEMSWLEILEDHAAHKPKGPPPLSQGAHRRTTTEVELAWLLPEDQPPTEAIPPRGRSR